MSHECPECGRWCPDVCYRCADTMARARGEITARSIASPEQIRAAHEALEDLRFNYHSRPSMWGRADALVDAIRAVLPPPPKEKPDPLIPV